MDNEQWKLDGICSKCRREKYCSHKCKTHLAIIRFELWDVCKKTKSEKLLSMLYKK